MPRRLLIAALALCALALCSVSAGTAGRAAKPAPRPKTPYHKLPFDGFHSMLVEPRGRHLFVTGGADSRVAVFTYGAKVAKLIDGVPGAAGMALDARTSTVYVAARTAASIVAIDTRTLRVRKRYALTAATECPDWPALAAGRVWFAYGCEGSSDVGVASLDPKTGQVQTYEETMRPWPAGRLLASPKRPDRLLVADRGQSPSNVRLYSLAADGTPTEIASRRIDTDPADWAISPNGKTLAVASGSPYQIQEFRLDTLTQSGGYPTGPYPDAVAYDPTGRVIAGGASAEYGKDVFLFRSGRSHPFDAGDFGQGVQLRAGGLAFAPSRKWLFSIIGATEQGHPDLLFVFPLGRLP